MEDMKSVFSEENLHFCRKGMRSGGSYSFFRNFYTPFVARLYINSLFCRSIKLTDTIMETNTAKPYKIKESSQKDAAYRKLIKPELADELYDKILAIVVAGRKYRDPEYSARQLAKDLNTNPRYLSAVINSRFGQNYSCLVNEFRIRDAQHLLTDKRYKDMTMEEIGAAVGFSNRQSFYAAFFKYKGMAPHQFRSMHK